MFYIGQKVICLKKSCAGDQLIVGKEYYVTESSERLISIDAPIVNSYYNESFRPCKGIYLIKI